MPDIAARLERAQEWLDAGQPARAFASLPNAAPAALSPERDFLAAEALRAQGYFARAAALYRKLLAGRGADRALRFESALGLASVHRSLGQVAEGRRRLAQARALVARDGRLALEDALLDRAEGRYPRALRKLKALLARSRRERDPGAEAFLLWATGGARRFAGDLAGAERDFRLSLAAARRAGDGSGQAYALFGLGGVSRIRGRLGDSERFYAEAGRRLAGGDDLFGRAYAHCGLANSLRQQGRAAEAARHYRRSHALYSRLGDKVDLAYVDWGLGKLALHSGRLAEAERRLRLAWEGFRSGREQRGLALTRLSVAALLHARGRTAQAERLFDEGVREGRRAGLRAHLEIFT